jgi:hypothetical protein
MLLDKNNIKKNVIEPFNFNNDKIQEEDNFKPSENKKIKH